MKLFWTVLILSAFTLFGCSRDGYKPASGDLGAFILKYSQDLGAHPIAANLPQLQADWKFNQTSDFAGRKVRIQWEGDHVSELEAFLHPAFGTPVFPTQTTTNDFILGLYGKDGVAVQFSCENRDDGKRLTRIEIQGPK